MTRFLMIAALALTAFAQSAAADSYSQSRMLQVAPQPPASAVVLRGLEIQRAPQCPTIFCPNYAPPKCTFVQGECICTCGPWIQVRPN